MDHDDEPDDDDRDLDLDHHAEWCKDNPIERALEETVQTGKNTTELGADERLSKHDLLARGGEWLGAAREWLKWHVRNGSRVTWGSRDVLEKEFTVADVEDLASDVAAAAMRPQPNETRLASATKARWKAEAEVERLRYAHAEAMSLVSTASAELTRLRAVAEAARAALLEIARPGVGPELHDTAEERADYWAHACEVERQTARDALAALAALEGA